MCHHGRHGSFAEGDAGLDVDGALLGVWRAYLNDQIQQPWGVYRALADGRVYR